MSDLEAVLKLNNLRRAYRWVMSNPDAQYKSYFRDSYDAFAIASDTHLKWIRNEGLKERYQVSHASKLLLPKPSGTLRPITLLRSEEHTSELQSLMRISYAVFCLKKKNKNQTHTDKI